MRRRGGEIFFRKLNPETAKNSLCKFTFSTKHSIFRLWAKFLKNGAEESSLGARAAVYRGAAVLFGAEDGAEESSLGAQAAVYRGAAVIFGAEDGAEESILRVQPAG